MLSSPLHSSFFAEGGSKATSATAGLPGKAGGKQGSGRIPVNAAATLASQEYQDTGGSEEEGGEVAFPSQNGGRPASGAVLWKVPITRASLRSRGF